MITIIIAFSFYSATYGETIEIDEIATKEGKIIIGLTKQEAIKKFRVPHQASEKFWHYHKPEKFWVYFKEPKKLTSISILPKYATTPIGRPAMFKAIGEFSDFSSEDISDQVQWVSGDEKIADFVDYGVMLPASLGTTQVIAFRNDIISKIAELNVAGKTDGKEEKIKLISLDILPRNPRVSLRHNKLSFKALGTFKNNEINEYFIEDISRKVIWQSRDEDVVVFVDNTAYLLNLFGSSQTEIFCNKNEVVSPAQVLSISDIAPIIQYIKLESITVLPRTVIIEKGKEVKFRAFGTFNDASVKEITLGVDWTLKDYNIATVVDKGKLMAKMPGITEVQASMDNVSSEPRKLVVLGMSSGAKKTFLPVEMEKMKKPFASIDEIENQVRKLKERIVSSLKAKLKSIQISPSNPEVPKGSNLQFKATGEYTDKSFRDLTLQVTWHSSNHNVATIGKDGIAQSASMGASFIAASLDKIKSNPQKLTVITPQLVSISIIPEDPTVVVNHTIQFKVQGKYTDKSTRDITAEVDWISEDKDVAMFSHRGKLNPQKVGEVKVFAKHKKMESHRQMVTVVALPIMRFLWMTILKPLSLFLLGGIIFLIIIYLRHRIFIQRLKSLMYSDPRSFVVRLYNNLTDVLALYGIVRKKSMPPGEYTRLVKKKYPEKDINKLDVFTERFNKAKYSSHPVDQEVADASGREYDVIITCVMKLHKLRSNFITYFQTIVKKLPLKISPY